MTGKKLIEVALPLEAINRESAREKSIRHGHPSTLHLWWARRPLAACRAVLFAQLVDDPSAHPEEFPTEADQEAERQRLFALMERLVVWENTTNEGLLREAHLEILKSTNGNPPPILDPFAGGGSIPLEAQRLGLEAHASDLNPVAVLINKALIEIPPKWAGQPPVFPGAAKDKLGSWPRATGLAEDVRRYGQWMRDQAEERIGHLYPKATLADGTQVKVIAWIWARTVTCPNPACGAEMPLISTYWLSKKRTRPTYLHPVVENGQVRYEIRCDKAGPGDPPKRGRGAKFACEVCGDVAADAYIKSEAMAGRMSQRLLAVVAEGDRQRMYVEATPEQVASAQVQLPDDVPSGEMPQNPRWFSPPAFGMTEFTNLFTNRQLVALTTFSDLVGEAHEQVVTDARAAGMTPETATAYANGVALYLGFGVSRTADRSSTICSWDSSPKMEALRNTFARQAIPMTWDYSEGNPFSASSGNFIDNAGFVAKVLDRVPATTACSVEQTDATTISCVDTAVSTDPPYYDNIGYADLSDFFYVWLRRSLADFYPDQTATLLTPKTPELVATPYRFGGSKAKAEAHFEEGFVRTFTRIREQHAPEIPLTIFYAFKQAEADASGTASTGWETMLNGLMAAGLMVTATWPMRTELSNRMLGRGTNALASSVVLACRPRPDTAVAVNRRQFITALKSELPLALKRLQQGSIAPVDLAQAAIGPGMAVFSRYARVVEADGSDMSVRTALALINQVLDEVLFEQEGDFDADSRFCIKWFTQFGWNDASAGQADDLSRATNTSVERLTRGGIFRAVAGKARLISPGGLSDGWNPETDEVVSDWEVTVRLGHTLQTEGISRAASLMAAAGSRVDLDTVKELAYLLYAVCEKKGWTESAILFNSLGTSWSEVFAASRQAAASGSSGAQAQLSFDDD